MASVVKVIDHGAKELLTRIYGIQKPRMGVGVFSSEGDQQYSFQKTTQAQRIDKALGIKKSSHRKAALALALKGKGVRKASGKTVLDIANINEFGGGNVPSRSFIRAWFDSNREKMNKMILAIMKAVVKGKYTPDQALEILGLRWVGEIQARIGKGIPPANAASTIRKKGSSKPLIEQGILRSAITFRIFR